MSIDFVIKVFMIAILIMLTFAGEITAQNPDSPEAKDSFQVSVTYIGEFAANVSGGGFTIKGLFESRAEDHTGFAIAHAIASSEYRDHRILNNEAITKSETNL